MNLLEEYDIKKGLKMECVFMSFKLKNHLF